MSVGEFDPASLVEDLNDKLVDELCSLMRDGELNLQTSEVLRYASLVKHEDWKKKVSGIPLGEKKILLEEFLSTLPFELTAAQSRCVKEISDDLSSTKPMSCLLYTSDAADD